MIGLTDFITEGRWEAIIIHWYILVDDAYQELERGWGPIRSRGPQPHFSDSEVITVGLIIDTWFGGDEAKGLAFVRQYHPDLFPHLPPNGHFNTRRQALRLLVEQVRRYLLAHFGLTGGENIQRVIDSAPVPVCQYGRAARCQTVAGPEYVGVISVKKARFFGFRLQATVTLEQVIDDWMLAPGARKDGKMMGALLEDARDLVLFGDNAYHDPGEAQLLHQRRNIRIFARPRKDSQWPWPGSFQAWVKRIRLRIETAFSVLTTVFHTDHPGSRSLSGLVTRMTSRILAYTLCFLTAPLFARGEL
jgi:hypothetical protein